MALKNYYLVYQVQTTAEINRGDGPMTQEPLRIAAQSLGDAQMAAMAYRIEILQRGSTRVHLHSMRIWDGRVCHWLFPQ